MKTRASLFGVLALLVYTGCSEAYAQQWESSASGVTQHLNGVFITPDGSGAVAVGNGGTVLSFDGTEWTPVPGAPDVDFLDVHGTRTDYFTAGGIDELWHCSNGVWNVLATNNPGDYAYTPVHISADESNIWYQQLDIVPGGSPFHFLFTTGSPWGFANFDAILAFARDGDAVRYVDQEGNLVRADPLLVTTNLFDNAATPFFYNLTAAWFVPDELDQVFAILNESDIYHFNGTGWTNMNAALSGRLIALGGTSSTDIYVTGVNTGTGDGIVYHYDGAQWSSETLPAGSAGMIDLAFAPAAASAQGQTASTSTFKTVSAENSPAIAAILVGEHGQILIRSVYTVIILALTINDIAENQVLLALAAMPPGYLVSVQSTLSLLNPDWITISPEIPSTGNPLTILLTLSLLSEQNYVFFRTIIEPE